MERSITGSMRRDHARLRSLLERLDVRLRRRSRGVAAEPEDGVRSLALELAARLGTHLTVEADAVTLLFGPFDRDASMHGAVTALHGEHAELRSMLAALVRTLDSPPGARRDEQLVVQLRDLVDLVRIHVRKEELLIVAAVQAVEQPLPRRKEGKP